MARLGGTSLSQRLGVLVLSATKERHIRHPTPLHRSLLHGGQNSVTVEWLASTKSVYPTSHACVKWGFLTDSARGDRPSMLLLWDS